MAVFFFVQEHGWFTHGFTCGKEKREQKKEPVPNLQSAVGDTVDPTCCNESLPRIAGHINECMLNLTVEAPLLNQNQKVVIMLILVFVLVIVVSGGGEGLGE